jgi:hypothetical protein
MLMLAFVVACGGCKKPRPEPDPAPETSGRSEGFTTTDWEELTGALEKAAERNDTGAFRAHIEDDTEALFEQTWQAIMSRADRCLDSPECDTNDKELLRRLVDACNWEAFVKGYRPGRLLTIEPAGNDRFKVTEVTHLGKKMSYLVQETDDGWEVVFAEDSRWIEGLRKAMYRTVDKILERNGLPTGADPTPPPTPTATPTVEPVDPEEPAPTKAPGPTE